jgi:lincosamide nucleotidyltransferase A/C/D/E
VTTGVSFWTRITHCANVLVWHAPLPLRIRSRVSALVYCNPPMPAARVVETLAALEAARVGTWVMGGWGLDALMGHQSRTHHDLDLIVDHRALDAALSVLAELGYAEWHRHPFPQPVGDLEPAGDGVVVRDKRMRVVDVHALAVSDSGEAFTSGTIEGLPVNCLSAAQQLRAHLGYRKRLPREHRRHRHNVRLARNLAERREVNPAGGPNA